MFQRFIAFFIYRITLTPYIWYHKGDFSFTRLTDFKTEAVVVQATAVFCL